MKVTEWRCNGGGEAATLLKGPFVVAVVVAVAFSSSAKVDVVCQLTRRAICRIRVDVALSLSSRYRS